MITDDDLDHIMKLATQDPDLDRENRPRTTEREHNEGLSAGAEASNLEHIDQLDREFTHTDEVRRQGKATIARLFDHGAPGTYVTRSRTLVERTRR